MKRHQRNTEKQPVSYVRRHTSIDTAHTRHTLYSHLRHPYLSHLDCPQQTHPCYDHVSHPGRHICHTPHTRHPGHPDLSHPVNRSTLACHTLDAITSAAIHTDWLTDNTEYSQQRTMFYWVEKSEIYATITTVQSQQQHVATRSCHVRSRLGRVRSQAEQ